METVMAPEFLHKRCLTATNCLERGLHMAMKDVTCKHTSFSWFVWYKSVNIVLVRIGNAKPIPKIL